MLQNLSFRWNFSFNTNLKILGGLKYLHTNYSHFLYLAPSFQIAFLKTHFFCGGAFSSSWEFSWTWFHEKSRVVGGSSMKEEEVAWSFRDLLKFRSLLERIRYWCWSYLKFREITTINYKFREIDSEFWKSKKPHIPSPLKNSLQIVRQLIRMCGNERGWVT